MTVGNAQHYQHKYQEKEECSRWKIHNCCGKADRDITEIRHDRTDEDLGIVESGLEILV